MRIYCDFDGTISRTDTTDAVLKRFADPAWLDLEDEWVAGKITAAQCMSRQIALLNCNEAELDGLLSTLTLRDGFVEFVLWCQARAIPLTIVSDGVDRFINAILHRHGLHRQGLERLPVVSNRLVQKDLSYALEQPHLNAACKAQSGVCKCRILDMAPRAETTVFIGDGRSDFCVSGRADILFARSDLARHAGEQGQDFEPFDTFFDVMHALEVFHTKRITA